MLAKLILTLILSFEVLANIPLNSTLMIYHGEDLDQCESRVTELELAGNQRVQIVPTVYGELNDHSLTAYYYKDKKATAHPFTLEYIDHYNSKLKDCMNKAFDLNMQVYLTPHIDDLKANGVYRNEMDYDPLKKYNEISFSQIFFSFLNDFSNDELSKIYLSLIGEMGRSLNNYMSSYHQLVMELPKALNIGLSFNYNKMLGNEDQMVEVIIPFINQLDFLGVSAYYSIPFYCTGRHFERKAQKFRMQMKKFGMKEQIRLHFTEVGIGGHKGNYLYAQLFPHQGVSGAYDIDLDPWQSSKMKRLRYNYHQCLLDMLETTHTIQAAFLWNSDSWDVQGVYPYSREYRDEMISQLIEYHNRETEF